MSDFEIWVLRHISTEKAISCRKRLKKEMFDMQKARNDGNRETVRSLSRFNTRFCPRVVPLLCIIASRPRNPMLKAFSMDFFGRGAIAAHAVNAKSVL